MDEVMYVCPHLVVVPRHGCEPWTDLAVKLMVRWPNLYYSTSAFAPRYYPKAIVDYANTRGADKIVYAGYFPMGLSLERIMGELPGVGFKDDVWPKFLRHNAARILGLDAQGRSHCPSEGCSGAPARWAATPSPSSTPGPTATCWGCGSRARTKWASTP